MTSSEPAPSYYRRQLDEAAREIVRADRSARRASWLRLLLLGVAIAALVQRSRQPGPLFSSVAAGAALLFVGAVRWHRSATTSARRWRLHGAAAASGLARIERRWGEIESLRSTWTPAGVPSVTARDLSVSGPLSLMRLMDITHPALGGRRLAEWLLGDPADLGVIRERQASTFGMRDAPDMLLGAAVVARASESFVSARALAAFRDWCLGDPAGADAPSESGRMSTLAAWTCGAALALLVAVAIVRRAAPPSWAMAPLLLLQLALSLRARQRIQRDFADVAAVLAQLGGATRMIALVAAANDVSGRFGGIQRRLRDEDAERALAGLLRLLEWNEIRYSPVAHWLANALAGFDVHLLAALARWRGRHARRCAGWLDDIADAEALLAMGTLAFEHPRWTLPVLGDAPSDVPLDAVSMSHPLLAPDAAVANDLTLAAPGDVVLVSGPNMAGKTTFLRALGLNVLLAQAGSVVAAERFDLRRCRLRTSVRIEDNLGDGVSLFMAEVMRLRDVIGDADVPAGPPVLFLFDEILHGTNAPDRTVATRRVLARLQRAGAAGVVTTHDPNIADRQSLAAAAARLRHLHFDGAVSREPGEPLALRFDYRARPGPSTQTNALAVLEMLGIDALPDDDSPPGPRAD